MSDEREIEQSVQKVGIDEKPAWGIDISNWGNTPSSISVKCYRYVQLTNSWSDVTALCFPVNTTTVSGNIFTLSPFNPQALGDNYRIEFKFTTSGGSILEGYAHVDCE